MRSLESWPAGPRGAAGAELGGGPQQQQGDGTDPGNKYVDPVADADAAASQRGFAEGFGAKVSISMCMCRRLHRCASKESAGFTAEVQQVHQDNDLSNSCMLSSQ